MLGVDSTMARFKHGVPWRETLPDARIQMIGDVELEQLIVTDELRRRPARAPDHGAEARAMVRLARVMAQSPREILQALTDEALELCRAGAAGISILETQDGNQVFRWHALSGILSNHRWGTTPREFSPCGTVVDRNSVLLIANIAQHFRYFENLQPAVVEVLLVPFTVQGKTIGTVWATMHDEQHRFDLEDERLLTNLGEFAAAAYHLRSIVEASQESDRRKDEFIAVLAHELRNPLSAVRAATHGIQVRLQSLHEPELQRLTDIGLRQLKSMSRMIDDLLDMARVRLSKLELRKSRVLISEVIQQAVESCRPMIEAARHHLEVTLPEKSPWVDGEPLRLVQIVSNLLNNAAKYTPEGGQIGLHVEQDGTQVIIRVRDTGVGIAASLLPRIFDLYAQGNADRDRAQGGLGIGLSFVRRLVELHGGQVAAHSKGIGAGSEFVVRLPLAAAADTTGAPVSSVDTRGPHSTRPLRILVVDDNKDSADSLGLLLSIDGHVVRTAYDGASALDIARAFRPDVALQDVAMPGMDGYQVASKLREFPETRDATLIALTGFTSDEHEQAARSAGFNHRLGKPVDFDALLGVLGTL